MNNQGLLSQLTVNEKLLVNSEVQAKGKNIVLAYILAIFFGVIGVHRFYMGKIGSGIAMLLITILTLGFGAAITGIWTIVDLFLIPGWIKDGNALIERSAAEQIIADRNRQSQEVNVQPAQNEPSEIISEQLNNNDDSISSDTPKEI